MHHYLKGFFLSLFFLLSVCTLQGQKIYDSRNGNYIPTHGEFRILNILVNIIYDQTPERDPLFGKEITFWKPGNPDKLNDNPPSYLKGFMDTDFDGESCKGLMSRLFDESSLGNLILLGDFVIVNIKQSEITPDKPGADFSNTDVVNAAVRKINNLGGVKTVYGHDSISNFDFFARGTEGLPKDMQPNGKIDFVMVGMHNTVRHEEKGKLIYNYGQNNSGEGYSYASNLCSKCKLLFGNVYYENELTTLQNIGDGDYTQVYKSIIFHEFSHNLFGGNTFHTSGGNHFGTSNAAVFIGLQGGYGLMGGYNSSLVCCNAFERWRMGWFDTLYNPQYNEVNANGENAAITKNDGAKTFILRDFITTGDAIRIKFPYVDSGAQNQYLWLENHQIGKNGKIDFLQYSYEDHCRELGAPGIYAFIQVGKDVRNSTNNGDVYPNDETDNLRHLTAKGNWDMQIDSYFDTLYCIAWRAIKPSESYWLQNPLSGYNDFQTHIWDTTGRAKKFTTISLCDYPWRTRKNGVVEPALPFLGDNATAFSGKSNMDIGSNPSAINVVTHYTNEGGQNFSDYNNKINCRKIYLTGLSVKMEDLGDKTVRVDIRWDQYHIDNNVRWTGDIVLNEKLYLDSRNTILLDQNHTPNQLVRDSISGEFSAPTVLTCENGSAFEAYGKSKIILDNKSTLIIKSGSELKIEKGCRVIIKNDSKLIIEKGAQYTNKGAKILTRNRGEFVKE
jgi:hypothetical protein